MNFVEESYRTCRGKRILLDANLLLLFLIGSFQRERIAKFKRTARFTTSEFDSLVGFLAQFHAIVTTPHILTEVSNLANALPEFLKPQWSYHFASAIRTFQEIREPALSLIEEPSFLYLGITDAAIHKAAKDVLILTEDGPLLGSIRALGQNVLSLPELLLFA
jgi:hypothetical protein